MYKVTIVDNIVEGNPRTETVQHDTLIDFLQEVYPTGFDLPTKIFDGNTELTVDEFDKPFKDFKKECIIIHAPATSVFVAMGMSTFWATVAGVASSMALSYVIGKVFAPDLPDGMESLTGRPDASTSYSLSSKQNTSRLGEPIPVIYGNVRVYPALVEQPFKCYIDNEEYIYQLMCLGAGDIVVDNVMIAESQASDVDSNIFTHKVFNAARNPNIELYIRATFDEHYRQRTRDLPEVSRLELYENMVPSNALPVITEAGYAGPYRLNSAAAGPIHSSGGVQVHFNLPGGLYNSAEDGSLTSRTVQALILIKSYNSGGSLLTSQESTFSVTAASHNPLRETFYPDYTVQPEGSWYTIEMKRDPLTPDSGSTRVSDAIYIDRITYAEEVGAVPEFGNITLLWTRAKASNALSNASTFRISAWVHRNNLDGDLHKVMFDLYTNTDYGAGLPTSDMDELPLVTEQFNGIFDTQVTVMDALTAVAKSGLYFPYLRGSKVLMRKDEPQPIRRALYNETNMIKDTLKVAYSFGENRASDGMLVKYRNPLTFEQSETTYPISALKPSAMDLMGCTDLVIAEAAAKYGWKQSILRKKTVTFNTDVQGLIPQYLDRIGIAHNFVNWGDSGQLVSVSADLNPILVLDRPFALYEVGQNPVGCGDTIECDVTPCEVSEMDTIVFRAPDGSVSEEYTFIVIDARTVVLTAPGPAWLYVGEDYDNTFFTVGEAGNFVKDYLLMSAVPSDHHVTITAINYDEEVYV